MIAAIYRMKGWCSRLMFCAVMVFSVTAAMGQTYEEQIGTFRHHYIEELLAEKRAPVKLNQVGDISFFAANEAYRVVAKFVPTPGSKPFLLPTHSGKQKPYRSYGKLTFDLDGTAYELHAYQSVDLMKDDKYKNYLFIPFKDRTNYSDTYGGGRYIDLSITDIDNGSVVLDFNKAYNPYCAYADGFSCPIPPDENSLPIEILAGEKNFIHN